jgi:hydrogenase maturation factor
MTLVTGRIMKIDEDGGYRMAVVSVSGASVTVPLLLLPDAKTGDHILIEGGVAIAVVGSEAGGGT